MAIVSKAMLSLQFLSLVSAAAIAENVWGVAPPPAASSIPSVAVTPPAPAASTPPFKPYCHIEPGNVRLPDTKRITMAFSDQLEGKIGGKDGNALKQKFTTECNFKDDYLWDIWPDKNTTEVKYVLTADLSKAPQDSLKAANIIKDLIGTWDECKP